MQNLDRLRESLIQGQALVISSPSDIAYFTQFEFLTPWEREALLVVTPTTSTLMYASFSPTPSQTALTLKPGCSPEKIRDHLQELVQSENLTQLSIDKHTLFVNEWEALDEVTGVKMSELDRSMIWNLRSIKTAEEVAHIRQAAQITLRAYQKVLGTLKAGVTEQEVELQLEDELRQLGAQELAFPTIVAFGQHTALPHHQPTDTRLEDNMPVLIDMGAKIAGYCADLTRTTWFGSQASEEFVRREKIVGEAYEAALARLKTRPALAKDLDQAAREVTTAAGYGTDFIHTTGHGLGLDIHEQPSLNWKNESQIKPGMVITIEPGIYQAENFGYRYENTVLVTDEGYEVLSD